jgi:hypothetical protein
VIVFGLTEAVPLQEFTIVRGIIGQFDGREILKSVYQDALAFMGGVGIFSRTTQDGHTTTFHPHPGPV